MKREKFERVAAVLAVIAWMAVIFLFSAQAGKDSGDTSGRIVRWLVGLLYWNFEDFSPERQQTLVAAWSVIVRKGAHFTEYAVLAVLIANALRTYSISNKSRWLLPVMISALYAVTDEIHQYFVPERACRLLDVGIDTCGAIFGMVILTLAIGLIRKIKNTAS